MKKALALVFSSRGLGLAGFAALCGLTLAAFSARFWWCGDLVANLRWQLGLGGLVVSLFLLLAGLRKTAAVAVVLALVHLGPALRLEFGRDEQTGTGADLTIASANLWCLNEDVGSVRRWLEEDRPDVVVLLEVNDFWERVLPTLADLYPEQRIFASPELDRRAAQSGARHVNEDRGIAAGYEPRWGFAVIARVPLENVVVRGLPEAPDPYFELEVVRGGRRFHVVGVHPERPGTAHRNARRDALLRHVAAATKWTDTSLVVGDFNATLYAPIFQEFVASAGLRDARLGFGRQPTWRPTSRLPGRWLDLDHILVRPGIQVVDCRTGPSTGSDHLPVVARIFAR